MSHPAFIDLFAGAGGLSLGLIREGFDPLLAVEKSPLAAETYYRNLLDRSPNGWETHLERSLESQIEHGLAVAPTKAVLGQIAKVDSLLGGRELDLLAGGPPCQGFSSAGLRDPEDHRNQLPYEFLQFVGALAPRFVLIENVVGIGSRPNWTAVDTPLGTICRALKSTPPGYVAVPIRINALHFGVAQDRPRIVVLGARSDLAPGLGSPWDLPQRSGPIQLMDWLEMQENVPSAPRTVEEALGDLSDTGYLYPDEKSYPTGLELARSLRFPEDDRVVIAMDPDVRDSPQNHVLRNHGDRAKQRFSLLLALRDQGIVEDDILWFPHGIEGPAGEKRVDERLALLEKRITLPLKEGDKVVARSRDDLRALLVQFATKKHSQRALDPKRPSRTVMSIPDDHVHYVQARTLTVREMARLQGFPDTFVFYGPMTCGGYRRRLVVPQYTQVGNAVPPPLAEGVGAMVRRLLEVSGSAQPAADRAPLTPRALQRASARG